MEIAARSHAVMEYDCLFRLQGEVGVAVILNEGTIVSAAVAEAQEVPRECD